MNATIPEKLPRLSRKQMALIRSIAHDAARHQYHALVERLAERVRADLGHGENESDVFQKVITAAFREAAND